MFAKHLVVLFASIVMINGQFGNFVFPPPLLSQFPKFSRIPSLFDVPTRPPIPTIPPIDSFDSGFGFDFDDSFSREMDLHFQPLRTNTLIKQMTDGQGGVTLAKMHGKTLVIREGTVLECVGHIILGRPFCHGSLQRFQIKSKKDFCYSPHYSRIGDSICVTHPDQNSINFSSNNGLLTCTSSDERPAFTTSLSEYQQLCNRMPWDIIYIHFPDTSNPFRIVLPNPHLGCLSSSNEYCLFKAKPPQGFGK